MLLLDVKTDNQIDIDLRTYGITKILNFKKVLMSLNPFWKGKINKQTILRD